MHSSVALHRQCLLYYNDVPEPLYLCPNGAHCPTWFQDPTCFTGTMDAFVNIVRHKGTRTFWRSLPVTLVMTVPATTIYFTAYHQIKSFLCGRSLTSDLFAPMVAGTLTCLGQPRGAHEDKAAGSAHAPFSALYWFSYELVKSWLNGLMPKDQSSVGMSFVAGGISGKVATVLTLPFDLVKTQGQVTLGAMEAMRVKSLHVDSTWLLLRRIRA
ncbi:hypothetical protein P7K49_018419, partial [Saguinus oedipus]